MSMRILAKSRLLKNTNTTIIQKFKNLLIVDFEATCERNIAIQVPEIIEFPCVAIRTENWEVSNIFHEYVKPRINPILSVHCIDLTGIMQETVENEDHFPVVFEKFNVWLNENGYVNDDSNRSAFVACGDWDFKVMLPNQCKLDGIVLPDYFKEWINLKIAFSDATNYFPRSIRDMLSKLELPLESRLHSGLSDSMNIVKIIQKISSIKPIEFNVTSHLHR